MRRKKDVILLLLPSLSLVSGSLRTRGPQRASLPVVHHLLQFAQTPVPWVGGAIQPSHPLLSPSPPTFSLSHIRVFSNESALHITWPKYWSFSFNISPSNEYSGLISSLGCTVLISLQSKGPSRVFSNTTVQKHQFFSAQPSLWSSSHIHTWLLEKNYLKGCKLKQSSFKWNL